MLPYLAEVMANRNSEESRVSVQTIAHMTSIYANFVKYGYSILFNSHLFGVKFLPMSAEFFFNEIDNFLFHFIYTIF